MLAEVAGYEIMPVIYDEGRVHGSRMGYGADTLMLDWGHITDANVRGDWDRLPEDPLLVLLVHSDCDGHIAPREAAALAERLEELLPALPDGTGGGHIGDWRAKTQTFIDGIRQAARAGETVEFH